MESLLSMWVNQNIRRSGMHKTVRTVPMDGYLIGCLKVLREVCFGAPLDPRVSGVPRGGMGGYAPH